ncbi:hypothetical protein HMN09_01377200 [Mycena chlorophos]|uniref:Uncharacterized protein n=1 Tax=Mycena chlorophos TaxID=658473 RepID=A0A8H6RXI3_MYCCL|nr:hypothetical protein HMN09_01377200 [Mycena chlorophos]
MSVNGPEAQDALLASAATSQPVTPIPESLRRATTRLQFPPSYVVVGVYRLFTDKLLYVPAWQKCHHGVQRGAIAGLIWAVVTFSLQRQFIKLFLSNSPRVTGLSHDTVFGYQVPFSVTTYAAVLLVGRQITWILRFFLAKNIRIARERAWDQTVASRGKSADFWIPYVEEWQHPPRVVVDTWTGRMQKQTLGFAVFFALKNLLLLPFNFYPGIGILVSAWFKGLGTAHRLHRQYFATKKMTPEQIAVFMEERKWDYRTFGFTAALLEGLPIIGLVFSVSNRVGAAMWAHDLEKRQHYMLSLQTEKEK